jgi:hypothetical protein
MVGTGGGGVEGFFLGNFFGVHRTSRMCVLVARHVVQVPDGSINSTSYPVRYSVVVCCLYR